MTSDDDARKVYELVGRAMAAGAMYEFALVQLVNTLLDSPVFAPVVTGAMQENALREMALKLLDRHIELAADGSILDGKFPVAEVADVRELVKRGGRLLQHRHRFAHSVVAERIGGGAVLVKGVRRRPEYEITPSDEGTVGRLVADLHDVSSKVFHIVMRMQGLPEGPLDV